MKKSFKKYLSLVMVLMVAFVCLFGVSVSAADGDITFTIGTSNYTSGYAASGTTATKSVTSSGFEMSYTYKGVNTQSSNGSAYAYTMYVKNYGYIYSSAEISGYYPSKVSVTFSSSTGLSGKIITTFSSSSISTRNTSGTVSPTKSGTYTMTNNNPALLYWNFSTNGANVQVSKIDVTYSVVPGEAVPSVELSGGAIAYIGNNLTLTAVAHNTTSSILWESSNNSIATVNNGVVTPVAMGKATITAKLKDNNTIYASKEIVVYPSVETSLTIAEAKAVCKIAGSSYTADEYTIEGVITSLLNTTYGNFYVTDGVNELYVYGLYSIDGSTRYDAMAVKPVVGDKVIIKGVLGLYNSTEQMKNAKLVEIVQDDEADLIKEELNKINAYMSLGYKYFVSQEQGEFISEAKAAYTQTTTTNMTDGNNAAIIGLDEDVFEVKSIKGSQNNHIGLNKAGEIRLYANASDQNGSSLSISTKNGQKIASVSIEFGATVGAFTVNGEDGSEDVAKYTINDSNVTIKNVTSVNTQVWIKSITITLEVEENATVNVYSDVDFRLRLGVDKALANIEGVEGYGIQVNSTSKEKEYLSDNEFFGSDEECLYVVVSLGDVLTNSERLTDDFTVRAFVVIDGISYYSELSKTYSVASLVEYYYEVEGIAEVKPLYDLLLEMGKIE